MKKLFAILLAVALVFVLVACDQPGPGPGPDPVEKIKLVYIVNGTLGDKSFFDSGKEGLDLITARYGDKVECEIREMTYDSSIWKTTAADIVAEGWDIVIAGTWDMKEYITELAAQYPETKFWFFDEEFDFATNPLPNVYAMLFMQNQGSFLVGMAAAAQTTTGKVAFMGGYANTVLQDFMVGYNEGAEYYAKMNNKSVTVSTVWTNDFGDSVKGATISEGLYAAGNDVVFSCCGACGLGTFDSAIKSAGRYVVGVDGDQGAYWLSIGNQEKAVVTITSMQKNVNKAFFDAMEKHIAGTLAYGTNARLGLDGGFVSYSPCVLLSPATVKAINDAQAAIIAGTIKVSTSFGMTPEQVASYENGTWKN